MTSQASASHWQQNMLRAMQPTAALAPTASPCSHPSSEPPAGQPGWGALAVTGYPGPVPALGPHATFSLLSSQLGGPAEL